MFVCSRNNFQTWYSRNLSRGTMRYLAVFGTLLNQFTKMPFIKFVWQLHFWKYLNPVIGLCKNAGQPIISCQETNTPTSASKTRFPSSFITWNEHVGVQVIIELLSHCSMVRCAKSGDQNYCMASALFPGLGQKLVLDLAERELVQPLGTQSSLGNFLRLRLRWGTRCNHRSVILLLTAIYFL